MKNSLIIIILLASLSACSSPLDRKFAAETFQEDTRDLFTELDTSEAQLIMGTVLRLSIQKKDFTQMTYRQLLEDGKGYLDSLGNSSE